MAKTPPRAASRRTHQRTVQKKVFFYRANTGLNANGDPLPFRTAQALGAIDRLAWDNGDRYLEVDDDLLLACWVAPTHDRLRLANVRRAGLPEIDRTGQISPLTLPAGAGLIESIHVRFFRRNVVGAVFNFHGPRISRLGHYLREKAGVGVRFNPILRHDVATRLDDLQDIRLLDLRILTPYQARLQQADGALGRSVRALIDAGNPQQVELVLRPRPRSRRESLSQRLLDSVRAMLGDPELREGLTKLEISGYNPAQGKVEHVDLLADEYVQTARIGVVEHARSRALDDTSAYAALEAAHTELRAELEQSPELTEGE